jgi:hypothetical protein
MAHGPRPTPCCYRAGLNTFLPWEAGDREITVHLGPPISDLTGSPAPRLEVAPWDIKKHQLGMLGHREKVWIRHKQPHEPEKWCSENSGSEER